MRDDDDDDDNNDGAGWGRATGSDLETRAGRVRCCTCGRLGDGLLAHTMGAPAVSLTTFYCSSCWQGVRPGLPDGLNPSLLRAALRWILGCDEGQWWPGGRLPLYGPADRTRPWGVVAVVGAA